MRGIPLKPAERKLKEASRRARAVTRRNLRRASLRSAGFGAAAVVVAWTAAASAPAADLHPLSLPAPNLPQAPQLPKAPSLPNLLPQVPLAPAPEPRTAPSLPLPTAPSRPLPRAPSSAPQAPRAALPAAPGGPAPRPPPPAAPRRRFVLLPGGRRAGGVRIRERCGRPAGCPVGGP